MSAKILYVSSLPHIFACVVVLMYTPTHSFVQCLWISEGLTKICVIAFGSWSCLQSQTFGLKFQMCLSSDLSLSLLQWCCRSSWETSESAAQYLSPYFLTEELFVKADALEVAHPSLKSFKCSVREHFPFCTWDLNQEHRKDNDEAVYLLELGLDHG